MKRLLGIRHKISFRLYLAIGIAVALTFAASIVGWFSLNEVGLSQSRVNDESVPEIVAAFAVAQYTGDLITATDRLSTASTSEELAQIQEYIESVSPNLLEQVTFLSQSKGATDTDVELLARIQTESESLIDSVSEFESTLLESYDLEVESLDLRYQLADARQVWHSIRGPVLAAELAYLTETSQEEPKEMQILLQLSDDVETAELALSDAAIAVDSTSIELLRDSYEQASTSAEQQLAKLAHLPSHDNLSRAFAGLASLGVGSSGIFDVRLRELHLAERNQQLLDDSYERALSLIDDVGSLVLSAQLRSQDAANASTQTISLARVLLLGISTVSLAVALLVAWLLVSSTLRRLGRISGRMRLMAKGELEDPVVAKGRDEVAEMATALEVFRNYALEAIRLDLVDKLAQDLQSRNTELAEAVDTLEKAKDRLVAQEKLSGLGELVSGLAHEINNPLNFVNNYSEASSDLLLEIRETLAESTDGNLNEEQQEEIEDVLNYLTQNMERIVNNGNRVSNIVQSMLTLGRESVTHQPSNINSTLQEYAQIAHQQAQSSDEDFRLELEFDREEIDQIMLNPRDIGRVILNVVNNACYATDEKRRKLTEGDSGDDDYEPTLGLSTRRVGDRVEVRFRDNGTGIQSDLIDQIFNPFFTTKPTGQGIGLGLTISHDIVQEHNGTIEVTSELDEFTEVLIVLPVVEPEPLSTVDPESLELV